MTVKDLMEYLKDVPQELEFVLEKRDSDGAWVHLPLEVSGCSLTEQIVIFEVRGD